MSRSRVRHNAVWIMPATAVLAAAGLAVMIWFVQLTGWLW